MGREPVGWHSRVVTKESSKTMSSSQVDGQELYGLTSPLESLLTSGGDPRLRLDPANLLNGYGCQPWPRPEAFTFASSTATSISDRGFAAAAEAQQRLLESARCERLEETCDREAEWLREQIKTLLNLRDSGTEIVFSPSGTDSQVHALCVAQTVLQGPSGFGNCRLGRDGQRDEPGNDRVPFQFRHRPGRRGNRGRANRRIRRGYGENGDTAAGPARQAARRRGCRSGSDRRGGAIGRVRERAWFCMCWTGQNSARDVRVPIVCARFSHAGEVRVQVVVDACQMRLGRRKLAELLGSELHGPDYRVEIFHRASPQRRAS